MNLTAVTASSDNAFPMIDAGRSAIVVNPGEAMPVPPALDVRRLALAAILVTPHRAGRRGGVDRALAERAAARERSETLAAIRTWKPAFR
ncbi:MAG: hypothetical protein ABI699_07765 [Caldimonas sp.]